MSKQRFATSVALGSIIAFAAGGLTPTKSWAQCKHGGCRCMGKQGGHGAGGHGDHGGAHDSDHAAHQNGDHAGDHQSHVAGDRQGHDHAHDTGSNADGTQPNHHRGMHGGQMTAAGPYRFEVVYRPQETRVYLYDSDHHPMSARGVHGQLLMKPRHAETLFGLPLKYVAPRAGSAGQDYLAAVVDVSRVRDGEMSVTAEFSDLPDERQRRATFTQPFALSKPDVQVAALDAADRPRIERQKVCVVTEARLGSMGTPVKVLIGEQPIYLCCQSCLAKVKGSPEEFLAKANRLIADR